MCFIPDKGMEMQEALMAFTDNEIRNLLRNIKTIAIVGAKDKAGQPVDMVGRYLMAAGYTVLPVHPVRKAVWGLTTYASLEDIPPLPGTPLDALVLFRASEHCPAHAREALLRQPLPRLFWMQEGISSQEAAALMQEAGVAVVQNLCIKTEHERLVAGIPLGAL